MLKSIYLGFMMVKVQRVTVVAFGMYDRSGNGIGCLEGPEVKCGCTDVDTGKMQISVRIKIRTLPVGPKIFATTYFQNLSTLHCYYCR